MEKFVLSGKAKTVFQILELMAKGEAETKTARVEDKQQVTSKNNAYYLQPSRS